MLPLSWLDTALSSVLSHVNLAALLVFLVVFYSVSAYHRRRELASIPPGPPPWPVVGNFGGFLVPSFIQRRFGRRAARTEQTAVVFLTELADVYGSVYSLFVGTQLMVVLNGYDAVRDALSNHPDVFSDRPAIPAITIMTKRKGKGTAKGQLTHFLPPERSGLFKYKDVNSVSMMNQHCQQGLVLTVV